MLATISPSAVAGKVQEDMIKAAVQSGTVVGRVASKGGKPAKRQKSSKQKLTRLPSNLTFLSDVLVALQTARSLLKGRNIPCYFPQLKPIVEGHVGRRFFPQHLAQLKHLSPRLFDWR